MVAKVEPASANRSGACCAELTPSEVLVLKKSLNDTTRGKKGHTFRESLCLKRKSCFRAAEAGIGCWAPASGAPRCGCAPLAFFLSPAHAGPILVEMTTTNGIVPGTGISYIVSAVGDDGGPRNIFPSASSDNNVWTWTGGFPEFLSFGTAETVTVTFSSPVPVDDFVVGVDSTSASVSQLKLTGGTAETEDFNLTDSLQVYTGPTGAATYDASNGDVTATGQNQSLMIGSTSTDTVSSFSFAAGASDGGADGYTVFVGFVQPSVPEPSAAVLAFAGLGLILGVRAFRNQQPAEPNR